MVQHGPLCVSQLATMLKCDFDGVSKHLRVMRTAGVVRATSATLARSPLAQSG